MIQGPLQAPAFRPYFRSVRAGGRCSPLTTAAAASPDAGSNRPRRAAARGHQLRSCNRRGRRPLRAWTKMSPVLNIPIRAPDIHLRPWRRFARFLSVLDIRVCATRRAALGFELTDRYRHLRFREGVIAFRANQRWGRGEELLDLPTGNCEPLGYYGKSQETRAFRATSERAPRRLKRSVAAKERVQCPSRGSNFHPSFSCCFRS